jgi:hypothetical protein
MRFRLLVVLGLAVFFTCSAHAFAADVILVRPAGDDAFIEEIYHRLRGELRAQAVAFEQEEGGANELSEPASQALLGCSDARACIALSWRGEATVIRVWVTEVAGKPASLFEAAALQRNAEVPTLLAARAVALLSAALRRAERSPPNDQPRVMAQAQPEAPAAVRSWRIGAGVSGLDFPSRVGLALGPQLSVSHRIAPQLALGAELVAPLLEASVENSEASARLVQGLAALRLEAELTRLGPVSLCLAGGVGAHFLRASGSIAEGIGSLAARSEQRVTLGLIAGGEGVLDLSSRLSLLLDASALLLLPPPRVALGREVIRLGEPGLQLSAGLRFTL